MDAGALRPLVLEQALAEQPETGRRLGEILLRRAWVEEEALARAVAEQSRVTYTPPEDLIPDPDALALVTPELARRRTLLPLRATPREIILAVSDPSDLTATDEVRFQTGRRVEATVASGKALASAVERAYGTELSSLIADLPVQVDGNPVAARRLEREANTRPVVRLVEQVLREAVDRGASDVHLEDEEGRVRVRVRVDGILRTLAHLPHASHAAVISRIKVLAGMDIAERRKPQDGGFLLPHGKTTLTVRSSTVPADGGEKAVLRLLDPDDAPRSLAELGMAPNDLNRLRAVMAAGQGLVIASGPTGSGKSTTLFAALAEVDRTRLNVVTLEDPVEYRVPGVTQVHVRRASGLTFPSLLRSVLRQDPDVIMVGEIRDRETAEIAMSAAVTGHLVLSTIHTTDAPGAVARLTHMGVPNYLVAGGLAAVVAQRLVRRLCRACRGSGGAEQGEPNAPACDRCNEGMLGRTGVFQLLVLNDPIREEIVGGGRLQVIRRLARRSGMGTLVEDARRKVAEGVTLPHEVSRVLQGDPGAAVPCEHCGVEVPTAAMGCPGCGLARALRCRCGEDLRSWWRFCPGCLRRAH